MNRPSRTARDRRQGGFTLVEIMVVIVIISLLATIVGQSVLGRSEKAEISTAQVQVKNILDTVNNYMIENARRIPDWEDLITPDERGYRWIESEEPPVDPWGNEYVIQRDPDYDHLPFIASFGPDRIEGTEDDITSKTLTKRKDS